MVSALGLRAAAARPSWLVGIAPTGGYQYDAALYASPPEGPSSLAVMAHHGGRDVVVRPEGCCVPPDQSESNCRFDIGIRQTTCTSVRDAFGMWSDVNGCSTTVLDEGVARGRRAEIEVAAKPDPGPAVTCWKGLECVRPTNLCMWNKEGHSWGGIFPGTHMAEAWFDDVFRSAEVESTHLGGERDATGNRGEKNFDASHVPVTFRDVHTKKGKLIFSATATIVGVFFLCMLLSWPKRTPQCCIGAGRNHKRKTSGDDLPLSSDGEDIALTRMASPEA